MSTRGIVVAFVAVLAPLAGLTVADALNARSPGPRPVPQGVPEPAVAPVRIMEDDLIEAVKALPPGVDPSNTGVQNIHRRVDAGADAYAQGRALGMSEEEARAYAAQVNAARQQVVNELLGKMSAPPTSVP
jgi:hypothetical protein